MPKPLAQPLELAGALGHATTDKRIEILRRVGAGGSISQAARDAGVSYKAAWQALDTLSNLAGTELVQSVVGGTGGGGASLTPAGMQLLKVADELARSRDHVLARLARPGGGSPAWAALSLRTSMRNQFPCTVQALRGRGQALHVHLALEGGTALVSRVTVESAQLLGLQPGMAVLALCKATAVSVAAYGTGAAAGTNLLYGRVTRASRSAAGGEVALELAAGVQMVGFAGPGSGLKVGQDAVARVDHAAIVIAISG